MDSLFRLQFSTIYKKNMLIAYRSKDIFKESTLPLFAGVLLLLTKYLDQLAMMAPLLIPLAISGTSRSTLIQLVEEKAERYKETQKIMGLKQSAYITAWISSSYSKGVLSVFTFIIAPLISGFPYVDNAAPFVIAYFLYFICSIHQSLCFSTMFSKVKMASEIGTILMIIPIFLVFLIFVDEVKNKSEFYWIMGLFPQCSIAFCYIALQQEGSMFYQNGNLISSYYSSSDAIIQLSFMIFVYIILYFYLDQVIPNEYGVSKHPLFFVINLFKKSDKTSSNRLKSKNNSLIQPLNQNDEEQVSVFQNPQDTSSALFHEVYPNEKNLPARVIIKSLQKVFGDFTAVDKISINLYESNIFCLLGHNGAGKTTTISLLTGLISKTSGNVQIYDKDLETDIDQIRNNIGLCTQRDCLYDDLTFIEQLKLIGQIKGLSGEKLLQEVEYILEKTGTHSEANKKVKELSGGQKRKLSLGMALIGGSKMIFLDEPTSGMDNLSRRAIWDILESVRSEERTLVLTTHHLDEAEVLADRIGIMAKGKLLAVGSSQFIKKNFGEGYSLRISVEEQHIQDFQSQWKQEIKNIIESRIKDCQFNPQTPADTILYLIPFSAQACFAELFHSLEKYEHINVDLEMNSLEDAFINIGMDEENFLERNNRRLSRSGSKNNQQNEGEHKNITKNEYTNFNDIQVPDCLKNPPSYSFVSQLQAIFLRRFYYTIRNSTNWISFVIALILLIAATVVVGFFSKPPGVNENNFRLSFMSYFMVLAYTFNSAIFIQLPVMEREYHLKYALNVMGCRVLPYWLGTFLFDFAVFFLTIVIFIILCFAQNLTYVTDEFVNIFFILVTFGSTYITSSYFWGFIFQKSSAALKFYPLMNYFVVFSLPWIIIGSIYELYDNNLISTTLNEWLNGFLEIPLYLISPLFSMNVAFISVYPQTSDEGIAHTDLVITLNDPYQFCLMQIASASIFMGLTLYIEQRKYGVKNTGNQQNEAQILAQIEEQGDQLVEEENQKVVKLENQTVRVKGLTKIYDNGTLAIKNTNFTFGKGEIFGLLGPNGAGKSSTFSILTSLIPKSYGSLKIKNIEVDKGIMEIYQDVGICPQFDCLWENLSPPEHLKLFGRMKGLKGKDLDESVDYFLKAMQLTEMVKKKAGQLSGGNKRKLCVANALIGGPDVQFFDEPSTGVDPIARRFLWNTLNMGIKLRNSAICMTTHTMEEAESLCTKIGILIKGQFVTIGTPQQLRNKYGQGYNITIKLNQQNKDDIKKILEKTFPSISEIPEKRSDYCHFNIKKEEFKFSKAFNLCENELKGKQIIEDFSINQSSLEQVYLQFSRFQNDDSEVEKQNDKA
ncbi:ABC transporter family protein (macronuclear) [Tetrahymena thermophila SB210]|uniref:ABC transporter family protein n=1 Tax=Tetrahymena thermophila (strain SB210) TaxID=312017 RepID=Q237H9_TETTS|nr:ABC transporter family protein [Tetrahymena thermophila SB210]EAR92762.2 ABC transporter family protein [Tetrahymena thermophila SB210]|eukprot:XP_001013007.2 ABC transporter family protein [Tetrahymena thermophila SB210]